VNGQQGQPQKPSGLAIAALVLSLLPFIPLAPLVGLVLGVLAIRKIRISPALKGQNMAIAAIALGSLYLVVGLLTAIAVPAFLQYIRRAKESEAEAKVSELSDSAEGYYHEFGRLPESTPLTPARRCCEHPGGRCPADPADWSHPTWQALNFAISDLFFYQYQFVSDGTSFTARAVGDLDCDGIMSTFERVGTVRPGGAIQVGSDIIRTRPDE
jgi:hypothetical protein